MPKESGARFEAVATPLATSSSAVRGKMFGMPTTPHGAALTPMGVRLSVAQTLLQEGRRFYEGHA